MTNPTQLNSSGRADNSILTVSDDKHDGHSLTGYIKKTYAPSRVETPPYGCLDFDTYTLKDGIQRAYCLRIFNPKVGDRNIRRCDYPSEREYNRAIMSYFKRYPSIYFSVLSTVGTSTISY
jgi:hypothetical protein